MDWIWFLFRFEGRINRARYVLATLAILCAMFAAVASLAVLAARCGINGRIAIRVLAISYSMEYHGKLAKTAWWFPEIGTLPLTLALNWAYAAVSIKRLHDRNKGGWWMIPFGGLTALYVQFGYLLGETPEYLGLVSLGLLLWGFVEMCFLKGTGGPNRFGSDRLAPAPETAAGAGPAERAPAELTEPNSAGCD